MERKLTEEARKFKDIDDFDLPTKVTNNLIWAREVLSLLDKGYEAEDDSNDREGSVKPVFLIGEALDKLTEAGELNDELWDRYRALKEMVKETIKETIKEIVEDPPEYKKFKKKNGKD